MFLGPLCEVLDLCSNFFIFIVILLTSSKSRNGYKKCEKKVFLFFIFSFFLFFLSGKVVPFRHFDTQYGPCMTVRAFAGFEVCPLGTEPVIFFLI